MENSSVTELINVIRKQFKLCGPAFIALGDEIRQEILMILSESPVGGMNVTDITSKTNLSRPAISHHLKILKAADCVESIKRGTQVFYYITLKEAFNHVKELVTMLDNLSKIGNANIPGLNKNQS